MRIAGTEAANWGLLSSRYTPLVFSTQRGHKDWTKGNAVRKSVFPVSTPYKLIIRFIQVAVWFLTFGNEAGNGSMIGSVSISILVAFLYVTDGKKQPHIIFVVADDLGEFLNGFL